MIGKSIILGVAAIWDRRKGLDDFITLSKRLSEDYKIILVGLTEEQIKNLPNRIIGISRTNSVHELANLYSIADVFVNPTYEDNYPTTNLEAIACGTPVVTYETGGSPESADMYGISVPKKDIEKLIRTIENTVSMKPDSVDIDNENTVLNYVELYEELNDESSVHDECSFSI